MRVGACGLVMWQVFICEVRFWPVQVNAKHIISNK